MIGIETGYLMIKVYLIILAVLLLFGIKKNKVDKTEIIIYSCIAINCNFIQTLFESTDFYTYYLYFAANCMLVVVCSLLVHVLWRINHSKAAYSVYGLFMFKTLLYLILYRVRVVLYDTDEPIMWLINGQSFLILLCDFFVLLILALRVSKWKLRYIHFS
jgi:hypothetical protein